MLRLLMASLTLRKFFVLTLTALLCGCAGISRTNWVPSPNFNERRPNFVIIHQTDSISHARALNTLTDPARGVSAHYLIAKNGNITQLVEEKDRAWHAGKSWWGGQTDINSASIGIELDNQGELPFESAQIEALLTLLQGISERYRIPVANYLAHGDVAPGRKVDPNYTFPWKTLAERGFGIWCSTEESASPTIVIDPSLGLQALGYDINNHDSAARAFRRHFRGDDSSAELADEDLRVLSCLLKKKTQANGSKTDAENGSPYIAAPSTANGIRQ